MLACAMETLFCAHAGVDPSWDLGDFRYGSNDDPEDDPDFDPLAKDAQPAEMQIAILQQVAARHRGR